MDKNDLPDEEKEEKRNLPEFIYLNDHFEEREQEFKGNFEEQFSEAFEGLEQPQGSSIPLRITCFICSLFILAICLLALPFAALFFGFNLLTFFKLKPFWKQTLKLWDQVKKMTVVALGLLIAVVSPTFGIAVILVYFVMKGENLEKDWFSTMMKSQFRR